MERCRKCRAFLIEEGAYVGQCCNPSCEDGFLRIASDAIQTSNQQEKEPTAQEADEWNHLATPR